MSTFAKSNPRVFRCRVNISCQTAASTSQNGLAMSETELKYVVPEAAARAVDASLRRLGARQVSIESRYFDCDDGRLAASGISLRLRRSAGRWEQTVKAPGRHAVERLEETVPRPGRWGAGGPGIDASLHFQTRAGALLQATLQGEDPALALLMQVCTTRVRRRAAEIDVGSSRVEVAFDRGTIVAGDRSLPICEVEYELEAGDPRALIELARAGVVAHGMWLSTLSKAARGDAQARHAGKFAAVRARPPELRRNMSADRLRLAIMKACVDQVSANASILADGGLDDEVIHQLRVGLRRLRTAVRELDAVAGGSKPVWEVVIATLFGQLGDYRDRSIVADSMGHELAAAGSPEPVLRPVAADIPDPVALLRGGGVQMALLEVVAESMPPSARADAASVDSAANAGHDAQGALAARLDKLHGALEKAAQRFQHIDDNERHRVRKRLKRLRYLAELVGPLYAPRSVERYLAKLRPVQDALGVYIDLIVGIELARENVAAGDARAWFNVGWLSAQLPMGVKRCRKALEQAATARPFWRRS